MTNICMFVVAIIVLVCYHDSMESAGAITFEDDLDTVLNDTAGHLNALHGRLVDACVRDAR